MVNVAVGILLGVFLLVLFALASNFVSHTIDSKAERISGLSGNETPAILVRLGWREWRDALGALLFTGLIWGVIAFGTVYWFAYSGKDNGLHWNTIAGFTFATIFGLASLATLVSSIKTFRLWCWFRVCRRNRTDAKILYVGERTQDELDSFRSFFALSYSYVASAPVERTFVVHEEIGAWECERLKHRPSVRIEYARANPQFVRRLY